MARYSGRKLIILRTLIPLTAAAAALFLAMTLLKGPVLGGEFDYLLEKRTSVPLAGEILFIKTGESGGNEASASENVISPALARSLLITLSEMRAASLLIQVPILGVSTGSAQNSSDILYRFDEEFRTVNGNIKELFEGIRLGSVEPDEAPQFVDELLLLNEKSKERLLKTTLMTSEEDAFLFERALEVFGGAFVERGLEVSVISHSETGKNAFSALYSSAYSNGIADKDGKVRRVAPFISIEGKKDAEHIAYQALKKQFPKKDFTPPYEALTEEGAIIFELPRKGTAFKSVPLERFLRYDDLGRTLYKLLKEEVSLSNYGGILPVRYPPFLYENALKIESELFERRGAEESAADAAAPAAAAGTESAGEAENAENAAENTENAAAPAERDSASLKQDWLSAREEYFLSLEDFFSGKVEEDINGSFEKLISEEKLDEAGTEKLIAIRDGELQKYFVARELYEELAAIRSELGKTLAGAFCILGASAAPFGTGAPLTGADISSLLANSLLTSRNITLPTGASAAIFSFTAVLIAVAALLFLPPLYTFICGLFFIFLTYIIFAARFVVSGEWLDPLLPFSAVCAAVLASFLTVFLGRLRMALYIKRSFSGIMSKEKLKNIIKSKKTLPENYKTAECLIIAVLNPDFSEVLSREGALAAAKLYKTFREEVSNAFIKSGAVIISGQEDIVLAAFNSPLEELAGAAAVSAENAVETILKLPPAGAKSAPWCFGADYGECSFNFSFPSIPYCAQGEPVVRARRLSRLCLTLKVKTIISAGAARKTDGKRLKPLSGGARTPEKETLFELTQPP